MAKTSYLKVQILKENKRERTVRGQLQDNTNFEVTVPYGTIKKTKIIEDGNPVGWLTVENFGQRENIVSIKLPGPIIDKGHFVNVRAERLKF